MENASKGHEETESRRLGHHTGWGCVNKDAQSLSATWQGADHAIIMISSRECGNTVEFRAKVLGVMLGRGAQMRSRHYELCEQVDQFCLGLNLGAKQQTSTVMCPS